MILIDGYNLLHASGVFGRKDEGLGMFEMARRALLSFLATALQPDEVRQTLVVFDAVEAPPGLPDIISQQGITSRFARGYADADTLIEELIEADTSPRQLTVVSSDRRIQRAARRRKAGAVDSEVWWKDLLQRQHEGGSISLKPDGPLSEQEVQHWLKEFGEINLSDESPAVELDNPFPPGYGEDLFGDNS